MPLPNCTVGPPVEFGMVTYARSLGPEERKLGTWVHSRLLIRTCSVDCTPLALAAAVYVTGDCINWNSSDGLVASPEPRISCVVWPSVAKTALAFTVTVEAS